MINERKIVYFPDEPVASILESVRAGEWDVDGEFGFGVILTHREQGIQLSFRQQMLLGVGPEVVELKGEPWMECDDRQLVANVVNAWLRSTSKERNKARLTAERNKFMVLVKDSNEQT